MSPHRSSPAPRVLALLLPVLCAGLLFAAVARADDEERARPGKMVPGSLVPHVKGMTEGEAVASFLAIGLEPRVVAVASEPVGRVLSQHPLAGARVESGLASVLEVGIAAFVQTTVPRVVGMPFEDALRHVEPVYALEVREVDGPHGSAGIIVGQAPQPGVSLPFRGRMRIDVVRRPLLVPSVVGRTLDVAQRMLGHAGLSADVREVHQPGVEPGLVLSQDPRSGSEILPGSSVRLSISAIRAPGRDPRGLSQVVCPDLVGLAYPQAEDALLSLGLVPHVAFQVSANDPPWHVFEQLEPAGQLLERGSTVHFRVARRARWDGTVPLPHVVGTQVDEAMRVLGQMGFRTTRRNEISALRPGLVVRSLPEGGAPVSPGSDVVLSVSVPLVGGSRPPDQRVPDLRGRRLDYARRRLFEAGFVAGVQTIEAPAAPEGLVVDQDPQPGSRHPAGSEVVLLLPAGIRVPEVVGMNAGAARDRLRALGLAVRLRGPSGSAGARPGMEQAVISSQEPAAGTRVPSGSAVVLSLGVAPVDEVVVPNLLGRPTADARQLLEAAGFEVVVMGLDAAFGRVRSIVRRMDPVPGTNAPRGSRVRLHVDF